MSARIDAELDEYYAGMAAACPEGFVAVDGAALWEKIVEYAATKYEHGRSMCCASGWETEAIEQTIPPLANAIRSMLGLDPLL